MVDHRDPLGPGEAAEEGQRGARSFLTPNGDRQGSKESVTPSLHHPLPLDARWAELCRVGDRRTWRAFYEQHVPLVYRVIRRMGVPDSEVGDVCQEVFLRVYRGVRRFRGEAQLSTWLYRIVVREAARAHRSRKLRQAFLSLLGRQAAPAGHDPRERREATRELQRVLARMKPRHREVFVLFEWEEMSLDEVARTLECPLETVRSRLRRARAEFRRLRGQEPLGARGESS
jgi:RNA polymerase sigma-70 factor (ECF subfamily)